jgi:apyrase
LLPEGKAEHILTAVKDYLGKTPFKLDSKTGVTILDGSDEGAFAWLTLNYLLGHLGKDEAQTVAAIDLGGGSVQEAFALTEHQAKAAPDPLYVTKLSGGGKDYNVYVHSYLGYGLMAGRAAVLAWEETRGANPCIPTDHSGIFEYGGTKYELQPSPDGASSSACLKLVQLVLKQSEPCGAEQTACSFAGAWGGGHKPKAFYVSSYFWDRAVEAEIIKDHDAITSKLSPEDLRDAAEQACQKPVKEISSIFPDVDDKQAPFMCLDLSFCHSLLTQGFRVPEDAEVTLVKKIKYKSEEVEAAWPLGAAINLLNSL